MARPLTGDLAHNGMVDKGTCNKREGTNLWYLSKKEIEENSPSRRDGIDLKKETYLRKSYCTFMQDLGMRLKVPQVTIATAIIFCHRFFLYQSHAKNDRRTIAAVCMFLAGKVEETPRPLKDVIIVSYEIIHKRDPTAGQRIRQRDVYEQQKELILIGERVVLTTLGFDLNIHQPYRPLVEAIKKLKVAQNSLAQVAWNFVNDGLRTSLCLQFKAHHIAAGAIFLAAKFLKVKLPSEGEKVWWKEFGVTSRQLEEVSNQMLELYEQNRTPASQGSEIGASAGGWASHQAPVKLAAGEGPVSVKSNSQVERIPSAKSGTLNPPCTLSGSEQKRANSKEGDVHGNSQSQSNDHGSAESKSDISEHRLDDEIKERRHTKQQPLPYITEKKSEASDKSRLGSKPKVDLEKENATPANIESEEQKNGITTHKFDNRGPGNKDLLGLSQENSIKKIDKEKVKAALEKRKKLRGDVARKELMDDDDLIERELEDGVELAIEDEKVKRRRNQDEFNPSNSPASENHYGKGHKKIRNGSYQETEKRESGGINGDEVEDGEVAVVHDRELLQSRKRKAVESPDRDLEGKLHEDHIPGHHITTGDRSWNGRHNYVEKDQKRHAEENRT